MTKEIKPSLSPENSSPPSKRVNTRCSADPEFAAKNSQIIKSITKQLKRTYKKDHTDSFKATTAFSPSPEESHDPLNGTLPPSTLNKDEPAPGETSPPEQKPFPDPALLALAQASAESPSASFRELIENRTKTKAENKRSAENSIGSPKKSVSSVKPQEHKKRKLKRLLIDKDFNALSSSFQKMSLFTKKRALLRWELQLKDGKSMQDPYCWECHGPDTDKTCSLCVRSFHSSCLDQPSDFNWTCMECRRINSFTPRVQIPDFKLAPCLRIFINFFINEAQLCPELLVFPKVQDRTIIYPIDLQTINANIQNMKYKSIQAFASDLRWLNHNAAVCFGAGHKAVQDTQVILSSFETEGSEIGNCTDCYQRCYSAEPCWFTAICDPPHPLVWARTSKFPFWPAKAFFLKNDSVQCQFFGQHDVELVPLSRVYLISEQHPTPSLKKRPSLSKSLAEMETYVHNYIQKFGQFTFAPLRTPLQAEHFQPPYQTCLTFSKPSPRPKMENEELPCSSVTKADTVTLKDQDFLPKVEDSLKCLGLSRPCRVVLKKLDLGSLLSLADICTENLEDSSVDQSSNYEKISILNVTGELIGKSIILKKTARINDNTHNLPFLDHRVSNSDKQCHSLLKRVERLSSNQKESLEFSVPNILNTSIEYPSQTFSQDKLGITAEELFNFPKPLLSNSNHFLHPNKKYKPGYPRGRRSTHYLGNKRRGSQRNSESSSNFFNPPDSSIHLDIINDKRNELELSNNKFPSPSSHVSTVRRGRWLSKHYKRGYPRFRGRGKFGVSSPEKEKTPLTLGETLPIGTDIDNISFSLSPHSFSSTLDSSKSNTKLGVTKKYKKGYPRRRGTSRVPPSVISSSCEQNKLPNVPSVNHEKEISNETVTNSKLNNKKSEKFPEVSFTPEKVSPPTLSSPLQSRFLRRESRRKRGTSNNLRNHSFPATCEQPPSTELLKSQNSDEPVPSAEQRSDDFAPPLTTSQIELLKTLNKNIETLNQRLSQEKPLEPSHPGGQDPIIASSNSETLTSELSQKFDTFKTELRSLLEEYFSKHNEQLSQQCETIGEKLNTVTEECGYISIENREVLARTYKLESTQQNVVADECHLLFSKIKKELATFQEQLIKPDVKNHFLSNDVGDHLCSQCGAKAAFQCCSSAYYCSVSCQRFQPPPPVANVCSSIFENMDQPSEANQSFLVETKPEVVKAPST